MKAKLILSLILVSNISLFAAEDKVVITKDGVKNKSFVESISIKPYASAFASLNSEKDSFDFKNGAIGLEVAVPIYKNVGLSFDTVGIDSINDGPTLDRVGTGLNIDFPIAKSKLAFYGQSGLGYWIEDKNLDIILRAGAKYNFTDNLGVFADVGVGVILQKENTYQQLRGGLNLSF